MNYVRVVKFCFWNLKWFLLISKVDGKLLNFIEIYRVLKGDVLLNGFMGVDKNLLLRFFNEEFKILRWVFFFLKIEGNFKKNFGLL